MTSTSVDSVVPHSTQMNQILTLEGLIYLASPYSDPLWIVRHNRYLEVSKAAAFLTKHDRITYSPILSWHTIATRFALSGSWKYWERHNRVMLSKSDHLVLLQLEGWDKSEGCTAECNIWRAINRTVHYLDPKEITI